MKLPVFGEKFDLTEFDIFKYRSGKLTDIAQRREIPAVRCDACFFADVSVVLRRACPLARRFVPDLDEVQMSAVCRGHCPGLDNF